MYELLKDIFDKYGMDGYYLWDPLAAMICLDPDIAIVEKLPILMDLQTAQTKLVDTDGAALINVAMKIPKAEIILDQLFDSIQSHLPKGQPNPYSLFQPPTLSPITPSQWKCNVM